MKKCTLCIDRIYDENLPEDERKPACVLACPSRARVFGDIDDPDSEASRWIREGKGYKVMPEAGTDPANHYLPKRQMKIELDEDELQVKNHAIVTTEKTITSYRETISEDVAVP
jgi:Fe-S-cluster-containing dehydrogenase component